MEEQWSGSGNTDSYSLDDLHHQLNRESIQSLLGFSIASIIFCQWVLCKLVCNLYTFTNYTAWRKWRLKKKPRPGARTRGLRSNAEFQPCDPPIWPQFFVSNRHRSGHGRAAMLEPLRNRAFRLDLCDGMLSGQLACAWAHEPEVDGGALYLSLCTLSVTTFYHIHLI